MWRWPSERQTNMPPVRTTALLTVTIALLSLLIYRAYRTNGGKTKDEPRKNLTFVLRPPLFQWPCGNSNIVYRNFSQAVLQPHLSQTCFHRPDQENHRQVQSATFKGWRFWEKVAAGNGNPGFVFSVMSYNVLAQDLLDQHPYLYQHHNKDFLKWEVRWSNLLAEIAKFSPDILCLQEVQGSHLNEHFSHLAPMGYLRLYKQRTGIRTDGCAIFYKHRLINLIEHTTVEFRQPQVSILDRDNVAIVAKFAPHKHPNKEFVVATTHLLYNPRRQDVRLAQTQLLLTEVDRIAFDRRGRYLPVVITGDLNSTPDSAVYSFLTRGKLRYENLTSRSLQNGTAGPKTGKNFLPPFLRITDQCQHADLLPCRQNNVTMNRSEELKLIELKHSERKDKAKKENKDRNDRNLFSSGTLSHPFSLKSVYEHQVNGDFEATTYQDEWVSVDYIFFSMSKANPEELKLLERYRLPTTRQLGNCSIPSKDLGSDHLSLVAKFKLNL